MTLGKAYALFIADEVAMEIGRNAQSERPNQEQLPRGGLQQVDSSHDFGYLHGCVVDHDGELVGGNVIATPDDEITEVLTCDERLPTLPPVDERNGLVVG